MRPLESKLSANPFPPVENADKNGILAIGGNLSPEILLQAYQYGIFPWYNEPPVVWWYPDPRFVLFPERLIVSKSMQRILKKNIFSFTFNKDFGSVISLCRTTKRNGQDGSWINDEMIKAYSLLNNYGYAVSAEAWQNNQLVGGLYGVLLGDIFFGESMFSLVSNASKAIFIHLVQHLKSNGVRLIDCQVYTAHLASLGAESIPAKMFTQIVKAGVNKKSISSACFPLS